VCRINTPRRAHGTGVARPAPEGSQVHPVDAGLEKGTDVLPVTGSTATSFAVEFATRHYPDRAACDDAATLVGITRGGAPRAQHEEIPPGYYLGVSPGVTSLRLVGDYDPALIPFLQHRPATSPRDEITEWSAASRRRMIRAIGELDLRRWLDSDGDAVLMTLTLPGDWLAVAPSGRAFKRHVRAFWKPWNRDIGKVRCIWKLEFQDRGAPHLHALVKAPAWVGAETFHAWALRSWAEVVGATGRDRYWHERKGVDIAEGYTMTDPYRVGVYFAKHAAKGAGP